MGDSTEENMEEELEITCARCGDTATRSVHVYATGAALVRTVKWYGFTKKLLSVSRQVVGQARCDACGHVQSVTVAHFLKNPWN